VCEFFNFDHLRITLQSSNLIWGTKFRAPSLLIPPLIFSYLQALIHGFLWWWTCSWLIFSLKWRLQSSFFLLHSIVIDLQEAKDSIDEEDPRPTSSTWSYIMWYQEHLRLSRASSSRWCSLASSIFLFDQITLIPCSSSYSPFISFIVLWFVVV